MKAKNYAGNVPMTSYGDLLSYPESWSEGKTWMWQPNKVFTCRMKIVSMGRGRSAAYFTLQDDNNIRFPMFMTDIMDLIANYSIDKGYVTATWTFCKRGQNYGLCLAAKEPAQE